jgi:hypothetical protein
MTKSKKSTKSKSRKTAKKTKTTKKHSGSKAAKKTKARETAQPAANSAVRLTFAYNGDDVRLLSQQRTEMTVPPSDAMKGYGKHKGFWAELRSAGDKTLYRTVMHNPTKNDAEIFPEAPGESITRAPAPKRKGVFVVVLPDTDKGEQVILCRSAPATRGATLGISALASKPAEEILRLKLKK